VIRQFSHIHLTIALYNVVVVLEGRTEHETTQYQIHCSGCDRCLTGRRSAAVAFADSTTTTTTTTAPGVSVSATANATAWTAFQKDWKAYVDGLRSIRLTYRASVETSRATYLTAIAAATTPAEKQARSTGA